MVQMPIMDKLKLKNIPRQSFTDINLKLILFTSIKNLSGRPECDQIKPSFKPDINDSKS
jgi:hypothetical protein